MRGKKGLTGGKRIEREAEKNNEDVLQSKRMFYLLLSFVILYPPAFEQSVPSPGIKFRLRFLFICLSVSHIKAFVASPPLTLPSVGVNPKPEPISSLDQNQEDLLMRSPKEARGWIRPKRWPCFWSGLLMLLASVDGSWIWKEVMFHCSAVKRTVTSFRNHPSGRDGCW